MIVFYGSYGTIDQHEQIYLHITFGGVCSIQQRFISSPFHWKTALKVKELDYKHILLGSKQIGRPSWKNWAPPQAWSNLSAFFKVLVSVYFSNVIEDTLQIQTRNNGLHHIKRWVPAPYGKNVTGISLLWHDT